MGDNAMCPVCASGRSELDWIRSACVYDDASRMAVLPFKHAGRISYSYFMSRAMIWALRDCDLSGIDVIIPVPLAYRRIFYRAYNQAALLAKPIAKLMGVKIDYDSVCRKYRRDMGHMNARMRAENIRGVFSVVRPENIKGRKILLVDDVMTSGATFSELRRVLIDAGASALFQSLDFMHGDIITMNPPPDYRTVIPVSAVCQNIHNSFYIIWYFYHTFSPERIYIVFFSELLAIFGILC